MQITVLHYVREGRDFILDTDASQHTIGAVLGQLGEQLREGKSSKHLYPRHCARPSNSICTTKHELYTITYFMHYCQDYTHCAKVVIRMDHVSKKWLISFTFDDTSYHR